eukprot:2010983-Amphidinium_carterae.1
MAKAAWEDLCNAYPVRGIVSYMCKQRRQQRTMCKMSLGAKGVKQCVCMPEIRMYQSKTVPRKQCETA